MNSRAPSHLALFQAYSWGMISRAGAPCSRVRGWPSWWVATRESSARKWSNGEVGGPAVIVAVGEDEAGARLESAGQLDERAGGDAFPEVAEAAPAGDAVEVREDFDTGELVELSPIEFHGLVDQAGEDELPLLGGDAGGTGGVQNGPLLSAALAGRDAFAAASVGTDNHAF